MKKEPARSVVAGAGTKEHHNTMAETEQQQVARIAAQLAYLTATTTETDEQRAAKEAAQLAFLKPALEEYQRCSAMTKEEVVEEYRRAGKLHAYDPDKEKQKRLARVANLYPCYWYNEHMVERIKEYSKYLEEEEDDYKMGLSSLLIEE